MQFITFLKSISFAGNTGYAYLEATVLFLLFLIVLKIFQLLILSRLRMLAGRTKTDIDDTFVEIVSHVKPPFYSLIALFFAVKTLVLGKIVGDIVNIAFIVAVVYEVIQALEKLVDYGAKKYIGKRNEEERAQAKTIAKNINIIIKIFLWVLGVLFILSNLGINVTSIVASLGIGGIAVALALQNIFSDIFSSFSIYVDQPFAVGDFIIVGADMGTVEKVGLKSTRIKTLQGEQLVIPNQELTKTRIQNFKKMERRRVNFKLGIIYQTPREKVERIPVIIEKIIKEIKNASFDRAHFSDYGDFSLNFEAVYYVESSDYNEHMNIKQSINLEIWKAFEKEGIEFAYPTQTVFLAK